MFFIAALGLIITVIAASYFLERKRVEALHQEAVKLGYIEHQDLPAELDPPSLREVLFPRHGRNCRIVAAFERRSVNGSDYLIEFRYRTGSGKNSKTHNYIATILPLTNTIPRFSLRAENWFDKLADTFGFEDIDIQSNPEFSKKFHLSGKDKDAVRFLFTPICGSIPPLPNRIVHSVGSSLVVAQQRTKLDPKNLRTQFDELEKLAKIFDRR